MHFSRRRQVRIAGDTAVIGLEWRSADAEARSEVEAVTNKERLDLILRAMDGDPTAWESIRSDEWSFLVPATDLDPAARSKVNAFFGLADAAIDKIDPRWSEEHPVEMEQLRRLAKQLRLGEGI